MSISHLKLKKIGDDKQIITYEVYSFDFNRERKWEKLDEIEIDTIKGKYHQQDNSLWDKYKIYPIFLQELPLDQKKELVQTKYKSYSSGRWSMNLFNFIKRCLETKEFPDQKDIIS